MKSKSIRLGLLLGTSASLIAAVFLPYPSLACTPHPDYPDGCDGLNGVPIRRQPRNLPDPFNRGDRILLPNPGIKILDSEIDNTLPKLDGTERLSPTLPLPPPKSN